MTDARREATYRPEVADQAEAELAEGMEPYPAMEGVHDGDHTMGQGAYALSALARASAHASADNGPLQLAAMAALTHCDG